MPIIRFENQTRINLALREEIYRRGGAIASARVPAPFTPVDKETLRDLDELMRRLGQWGYGAVSSCLYTANH